MAVKHKMPTRKALIKTIKKEGSKTKAAIYYGVSASTVSQWCSILFIEKSDLPSPFVSIKRPSNEVLEDLIKKIGSSNEIGKHLGTSGRAVRAWCEQAGIQLDSRRSYDEDDKPLILELRKTMTIQELAHKWEVTPRTMANWVREWSKEISKEALCG